MVFSTNFVNLSNVKSKAEVTRFWKTFLPCVKDASKIATKLAALPSVVVSASIKVFISASSLASAKARYIPKSPEVTVQL